MSDSCIKHKALSQEAIVKALFENYECIYAVDVQTSSFQCFHESDSYSSLHLEDHGDNFFESVENNSINAIYLEDQAFVRMMLSKEALRIGLGKDRFYSFVYRLMIDGKPLYHKLRATIDQVDGRPHFLIGIRNVDAAFRQDKALAKELTTLHDKEITHLEAILASAEGYLEADLTKDSILELSPYDLPAMLSDSFQIAVKNGTLSYSTFMKLYDKHMVTESQDRFRKISDRKYLINCFDLGEKRSSVSFSIKTSKGQIQPCKMVFYLYKDTASDDILSFCVLYDLTEQQKKDKELHDLEEELQMIRLRNFTSQMQPHFLYNALGSIQEIVLHDPKYASDLIGDFTIHLRSCIRAMSNDAPIPFGQELNNIKAYVNIEKMRLGDKLSVRYNIQYEDFHILPLSVQPLVENAIRHGIYKRGERGGYVVIMTEKKNDCIQITVEDNGVGFDVRQYQTDISLGRKDSTGLKNIMFRLDKMMHATVNVNSFIDIGTTITITIPHKETIE